jgi:phage major head subunit gpT-like protein
MNRSQFKSLLVEGLRKVFWMQFKDKETIYPRIYKVETSKKRKETDQSIAGIGMLVEKPEGEPLIYDDFTEGFDVDYIHTSYAKGLRFSRELIDDELYGVMAKRTQALSRSARYRKEYDHAALFNNATGTTVFTGGDGKALLATDHPLSGRPGETYGNCPASGTDLSLAALEVAETNFRRMKDDSGLLVSFTPKTLLVPPELKFDAWEIINSIGKLGTADNDKNYFQGKYDVITWDFLTDTNAWFLLADKSDGAPVSFNRTPLEFDSDGDFDTKDLKVSAFTRYSRGFSDWRWVYGSAGST